MHNINNFKNRGSVGNIYASIYGKKLQYCSMWFCSVHRHDLFCSVMNNYMVLVQFV